MTDSISATEEAAPSSNSSAASMRIAVLDRDSGFIQVLSKRLDRLSWEHRVLASPVPAASVKSSAAPAAQNRTSESRPAALPENIRTLLQRRLPFGPLGARQVGR